MSRLQVTRSVLAIVNKLHLEVCQLDDKTALLNGKIDCEIDMEIPSGINCSDGIRREKV